jgi:hypothetical protein
MSQQAPAYPQFNYASTEPMSEFLPQLKIEEGKQVLVSFLGQVPGMVNPETGELVKPPFVFCRVHWNSEMGENGRLFQCFKGSCCQQVTWQKGWGDAPGKFDVHKAKPRFYIPVVHYEQDPTNPAQMAATVKYIDMTYTAYDLLLKTIHMNEGLDFFERDIIIEAQKVNGAMTYLFHKKDTKASWMIQPAFKAQVEEQLQHTAEKLFASMPKQMTEEEFMAMKPELDAKVKAAMASHGAHQQPAQQGAFAPLPGQAPQQVAPGIPAAPAYQQPTTSIPSPNMTVQGVPTPGVPATAVQPPVSAPAVEPTPVVEQPKAFEVPAVDLDFDPNSILNS